MNTSQMRAGARLVFGFGLVLMMTLILIGIALSRFAAIDADNQKTIEKDWVKAEAANTVNVLTRANARNTLELLIDPDKAQT